MSQEVLNVKQNGDSLNFQGIELSCPIENGHRMIPVKTVCTAIDVQFANQDSWLKEHHFYAQLYPLVGVVAADKKVRKMNCLSIFDIYSWVSSIKSDKRREGSIEKQYAFMTFIREMMIGEYKSVDTYRAENERELELQNLREEKEDKKLSLKSQLKELDGEIKNIDESIEAIRVNRFTGQTALQF